MGNESTRMVELFMRSGARVPGGAAGQELFRLAQRGEAAPELSRILLDYGAEPGHCLVAATAGALLSPEDSSTIRWASMIVPTPMVMA